MLGVVFWLAVACGVVSAATGNRTAVVLLASVGLCLALDYLAVSFSFPLWLLIDLAVVLAIIRPAMTKTDCVIIALFIPAWCFYLLPPETRFWGSFVVVVTQLALTFPLRKVWRRVRSMPHEPDRWNEFDLMVLA